MVIEWLKFQVTPELREKFIEQDGQIWTKKLASYPGFLSKEVWINPDAPEEVIVMVRWQTFEHWQNIPAMQLEETEKEFMQAMGEDKYKIKEASKYQVRKFPETAQ